MHKNLNPKNYPRYFLNRFVGLTSIALQPLEKYLGQKYEDEEIKRYPPIFIIGAPRTGSTIFYQTITNYWDMGYINNLECKLYKNILCGTLLSNKLFHGKPHSSFTAYHGSTKGFNSPSECGSLWYRWFPTDRHFVDSDEVEDWKIEEMKRIVHGIIAVKDKPFVFKNMNCGQRIRVLAKAFPHALFLFCKRDPIYTAQSLLRTREKVYGNWKEWWSIMPKEYDILVKLPPIEQVVAQIYYIEKEIKESLATFFQGKFINVSYEEFCLNPELILQKVNDLFLRNDLHLIPINNAPLDIMQLSNIKKVEDKIFFEIQKNVQKYFS